MAGLKEQVLSLPDAEKREIFHALQEDLTDDPIPEPIVRVLEERRRAYRTGEMGGASADEVEESPGRSSRRHATLEDFPV